MLAWMKRAWRSEISLSLSLLALVSLFTYAPLANQLGYYIEAWYVIWSDRFQGPASLIPMFLVDRPLEGYLYAGLFPLLGSNALAWQIFALLIRILAVFAFLWLLRLLWPRQKLATTTAALLFAVYPGFIQQPEAIQFSVHLVALLCAVLSLALSVYALQVRRWAVLVLAYTLSILLMLAYPLLMEYYIGLEGLRLLLIAYAIRRGSTRPWLQDLKSLVWRWLPYLAGLLAFAYWRAFIFSGSRPTTNLSRLVSLYADNLRHMSLGVGVELAKDFLETIYLAWAVPLNNLLYWGSYRDNFLELVVVVGAVLAAGALLWQVEARTRGSTVEADDRSAWRALIWIGLLGVLVTLLPVALANRSVQFVLREDRYTLPASLGVTLLVAGGLFSGLPERVRRGAVLFLLGVAVATQISYAVYLRDYWNVQKNVWWQLSWRAPQLKAGSLLLVHLPAGFSFIEGYEAWAPANLIYYPQPGPPVITGEVLYQDTLPNIIRGGYEPKSHRGIPVNRDFEASLVLSQATQQSCLNVIDGRKYELAAAEDPIVQLVAPYSHIEDIQTGASFHQPPSDLFGPEPEHGWCYYYQKATYARQIGDWQQIAKLGDEAKQKGLGPADRAEWMPFLEGYASVGREKDARNLAAIIKTEFGPRNAICSQLAVRPDYTNQYAYEQVVAILCGS